MTGVSKSHTHRPPSTAGVRLHLLAVFVALSIVNAAAAQPRDAYEAYVSAQRGKTDKLAANGTAADQWVCRGQIEAIAEHIRKHVTIKARFAFCHGTRSGREAVWFRELLPDIQTWGTELSPIAARSSPWTIPWDYHDVRPEWLGTLDFIYSNALDHSFNATLAIVSWMSEVSMDGALYIHWSKDHDKKKSAIDLYRGSSSMLKRTICKAGSFTVSILDLPPWTPSKEMSEKIKAMGKSPKSKNRGDHAYIVRHAGRAQDSTKNVCHE